MENIVCSRFGVHIDVDVKIGEHSCGAVSVAWLRFIQLTIQQLVGILLLIVLTAIISCPLLIIATWNS